ncbi:MAG: permease [Bacteroidales bacterium]|nr:permease [Bacteroidales bacterium]
MDYIYKFFVAFGQLALEMAPWLFLGFIFAGLFKAWFPDKWADKYLSKPTFSSVIWASVLGVPLPLCSCGVLPMAVSLHKKGASKGAINSFLISTPQTGVDNIMATYSLLGLPFAIARPIIAFVSGIFGGAVMNLFTRNDPKPVFVNEISCADNSSTQKKSIWSALEYGFTDLFKEMYGWLLVGLALAAVLNIVLPDDLSLLFEQYPGADMFLALLISIPMYICATGSIPIALVLLLKGFSPGAAIVLLMAGPATNIAGIVLLSKTISTKFATLYVVTIMLASLFFGFVANLIFSNASFIKMMGHQVACIHGENSANLFQWGALAVLTGLVIYFVYVSVSQKIAPYLRKNSNLPLATYRYKVTGMTCKNCAKKIDTRLWQERRVTKVNLIFEKQILEVETSLPSAQISEMIEKIGYGCSLIVKGFSYVAK